MALAVISLPSTASSVAPGTPSSAAPVDINTLRKRITSVQTLMNQWKVGFTAYRDFETLRGAIYSRGIPTFQIPRLLQETAAELSEIEALVQRVDTFYLGSISPPFSHAKAEFESFRAAAAQLHYSAEVTMAYTVNEQLFSYFYYPRNSDGSVSPETMGGIRNVVGVIMRNFLTIQKRIQEGALVLSKSDAIRLERLREHFMRHVKRLRDEGALKATDTSFKTIFYYNSFYEHNFPVHNTPHFYVNLPVLDLQTKLQALLSKRIDRVTPTEATELKGKLEELSDQQNDDIHLYLVLKGMMARGALSLSQPKQMEFARLERHVSSMLQNVMDQVLLRAAPLAYVPFSSSFLSAHSRERLLAQDVPTMEYDRFMSIVYYNALERKKNEPSPEEILGIKNQLDNLPAVLRDYLKARIAAEEERIAAPLAPRAYLVFLQTVLNEALEEPHFNEFVPRPVAHIMSPLVTAAAEPSASAESSSTALDRTKLVAARQELVAVIDETSDKIAPYQNVLHFTASHRLGLDKYAESHGWDANIKAAVTAQLRKRLDITNPFASTPKTFEAAMILFAVDELLKDA